MDSRQYELLPGDRTAYEKLPLPLSVICAAGGTYRLLLVSDGLCALLDGTREELMAEGVRCPLCGICAEDRENVRTAAEFAVINPGEESHAVCRLKKSSGGTVKVVCIGRAERLNDGKYLLFLTYVAAPRQPKAEEPEKSLHKEEPVDTKLFSLRQSGGYELLSRWRGDLTENRMLEYEILSDRALEAEPGADYEKICAFAAAQVSEKGSREELSALLNRENLIRKYREGETAFSLEYRREENGEMPFWVTVSLQTFESPSTGHIECYACAFDVTEKVLERQLLSRLTMLGYDVVGLLSVQSGKCRYFRIKKMHYGMRYEHYEDYWESISGDIRTIIAPDQRRRLSRELCVTAVTEGLQDAASYSVSYSMTTKDGRHRQKLLQFSYLDDARDAIFFCKSDITRQYEKEHEQIEQLQAAKLEADRANEAKSVFLSSMSHDLRTPLGGILGFTRLALGEQDPAKKQDYLKKVESSGALMLDLVNDTLELSRIESGKLVLEMQDAGLREMASAVLTSLGPSAEIKNLHLDADPSGFPDVTVRTDRLKFQKVFLNLLSNAIKYTPSGGSVSASITLLEPPEEGCNFRMVVRDTGIGIRPEFLPHIFDAFAQEHRAESASVPGTGLGLAIVRRIVDQMGGRVSVESVPDRGSAFTVLLPMEIKDDVPAPEEPRAALSLAGKRVLLCEDNYLNTEIARTILTERGMLVDCAENGKTGAELFENSVSGTYDAVLMDVRMPVMDGCEAARRIRAMARPDAASVPIVAMTGDAFEEDVQSCRKAGMNRHLTKPIDPNRLISALQEEIGEKENRV